jgi:dihydroorotate dehydrogenase
LRESGLLTAFLHRFDPETAHKLAVRGASALRFLPKGNPTRLNLATRCLGLDFPNPLGLAAGFDKDGEAGEGLFRLGFGFVEIGGVTHLPQPGNPRPRVFRLAPDRAVINRYGLNSAGMEHVARRLEMRRPAGGIIGVNLGPNKDSADRIADFVRLTRRLAPLCDYLSINISSPNTPGLRDLQEADALRRLMAETLGAADAVATDGRRKPVLFKIAPDLDDASLDGLIRVALDLGADGLIISNTTIARPESLASAPHLTKETGGLSGPPLFAASTRLLAKAYLRIGEKIPLIGVGGIDSAAAALAKIEAGASLLQLYTGLIYQGPRLIRNCLDGLEEAASQRPLAERRGGKAAEFATARR